MNLALGRLEAARDDSGATISAYQAALNNLWRPDEAPRRYQVRLELARYLLAHDQRSRALSELLIVSADMPDTAAAHAEVGGLFLAAAEPARALTQLERARALEPADQAVALASGQAAFAVGNDSAALRHLRAAPDLAAARDLAATITLVLSHDPLLPRLVHRRAGTPPPRRTGAGAAAAARAAPAPPPPVSRRHRRRRRRNWIDSRRRSTPGRDRPPVMDLLDDGVELIARIEADTASCGPPTPLDQALTLIGRRHAGRS